MYLNCNKLNYIKYKEEQKKEEKIINIECIHQLCSCYEHQQFSSVRGSRKELPAVDQKNTYSKRLNQL